MTKKFVLTCLLSLCVAVAGVPVQAMPNCPMMAGTAQEQIADANVAAQHDCPEMAQSKPPEKKKSDCCEDMACGALCAATISMNVLPTVVSDLPQTKYDKRISFVQDVATSHASNTQDRPPRILV